MRPIDFNELKEPIHLYGWQDNEIARLKKRYQAKYYGDVGDACFEVESREGNIYCTIFRSPANSELIIAKSKDYLVFNDSNRALLNIGGKLYRFLINKKECLNDLDCFDEIICNDFEKANAPYFHSLISKEKELMIVVDGEGVAAITWDRVLWKHKFDWAHCGHLQLTNITNDSVFVNYEDVYSGGDLYQLEFDIQTGKYSETLLD